MYYQCCKCGFIQKSHAKKSVKCMKCGKIYDPRKAKKFLSKEPESLEETLGFFKFKL